MANEQLPVFPMNPKKRAMNSIERAASELRVVRITYLSNEGTISEREIEPYEIRGNMLFAYSLDKNSIRQFKLERILKATLTQKRYTPRWPIRI